MEKLLQPDRALRQVGAPNIDRLRRKRFLHKPFPGRRGVSPKQIALSGAKLFPSLAGTVLLDTHLQAIVLLLQKELLQRLQIMHAVYPHLQAFGHLCLPDCGSILGLQSLCLLIEQFSLPCQDHTSAFTRKKREPDLLLQRSDLLADSGRHYAALLSGPCKTPTAHRA